MKNLTMTEHGPVRAITPSSNQDYEARLNDGLSGMLSLMQHVLAKKSIITQDVLLNIIHARCVDLISLRKRSN
jgi:hypothetical protein